MNVFIRAQLPTDTVQAFLQHIRDFDVSHPGCHFEIGADAVDLPLSEIVEMLRLEPALTFTQVYERKN
jgi:hypothetical protein